MFDWNKLLLLRTFAKEVTNSRSLQCKRELAVLKYWYTAVFIHFTTKINIINIWSIHSGDKVLKKIWGAVVILFNNAFTSELFWSCWSCWVEMTLYHGHITFVPLGCSRMGIWGENCRTCFSKRFVTCVFFFLNFLNELLLFSSLITYKFNQLPRLSGRWVPRIPRGFHVGQPAPR